MQAIAFVLVLATTAFAQQGGEAPVGAIYDSHGRTTEYHFSDGTQETYGYDENGRMTKFTDRSGGVTTFQYRDNGSVVTIRPDGSVVSDTK